MDESVLSVLFALLVTHFGLCTPQVSAPIRGGGVEFTYHPIASKSPMATRRFDDVCID